LLLLLLIASFVPHSIPQTSHSYIETTFDELAEHQQRMAYYPSGPPGGYPHIPSGGSGTPVQQQNAWDGVPQEHREGYGVPHQRGTQQPYGNTYEAAQPRGGAPYYGVAPPPGQPQEGYAPKKAHGGGFVMGQRQGFIPSQSAGGSPWPSQSQVGYAPRGGPVAGYVSSQPQGYAPKKAHGGGFVMGRGQGGHSQPGAYRDEHSRATAAPGGSYRPSATFRLGGGTGDIV